MNDFEGDITEEEETVSEAGRDDYGESRYINFAGHHQGPEAYLRWEQDMEDWFSSNQISEEEKTSYAEDTLTEDAFRIYERDAYIRLEYEEPDASWAEMKQLLYQEFVEDVDDMRQYNLRIYTNPEPRRWILATSSNKDYIVSRSKLFQGRGYDADIQTTQYRYDGRIKPAAEPKLIQTGGTTPIRPDKDICSLFEAYQLNHDDSRHETTWRLFAAQPQNTKKKNHPKLYYHEKVMGVTTQQFSDASDKDLRSHNESFRPDPEAKGNKSNCYRTPTNHKHAANWNQPIISSHEGDIVFLKQRILRLLYLEAHGFWRLQTYHWRPGDFMILLKTSYTSKTPPRVHNFLPKLSRYKEPHIFLVLPISSINGHINQTFD